MTRVLLISNDVIGEDMAGPGIRYWEFARTLGGRLDVTLAVPPFVPVTPLPSLNGFPAAVRHCTRRRELRSLVSCSDLVVTLGAILIRYPFLSRIRKPLVIDLYDPFLLENLQRQTGDDLLTRLESHEGYLRGLRRQLLAGDFFICADEKQRDYWLGALSASGRINPHTHQGDPTLRQLIDVVPFGLPEEPPKHTQRVLKGIYDGIDPDDKVILWGGGIWDWLDAATLIRAMPLILDHRPDVKLFFMGVSPPDRNVAGSSATKCAMSLSEELGLRRRHVFFNDWVPYEERQNYLLEADIGVSLHLDHVETRFSFRTRLLDYLWAGLPVVSTAGDVLSDRLASLGLARLVSAGDAEGVADTILAMLSRPSLRTETAPAFGRMAAHYRWDDVLEPLVEFCMDPHVAPDKSYLRQGVSPTHRRRTPLQTLRKVWRALRLGGVAALIQRGSQRLRWGMENLGLFKGQG